MEDFKTTIIRASGVSEETAEYLRDITGGSFLQLPEFEVLVRMKGITEKRAQVIDAMRTASIKAKYERAESQNGEILRSSAQIYDRLRPVLNDLEHEEFHVVLLNRSMRLIDIVKIAEGGWNSTTVCPKRLFRTVLLMRASVIILAHNHPSGSNKPSMQDVNLTKRLVKAGEILEVKVVDHIIVSRDNGYYSLCDAGDM